MAAITWALCRFDNQSRQYFSVSVSSWTWSGFAAKYSSTEAHLRWCLAKGTRPMFDQYLAHPIQSYISPQCKHIEFSFSLSVISDGSQHEKHFHWQILSICVIKWTKKGLQMIRFCKPGLSFTPTEKLHLVIEQFYVLSSSFSLPRRFHLVHKHNQRAQLRKAIISPLPLCASHTGSKNIISR